MTREDSVMLLCRLGAGVGVICLVSGSCADVWSGALCLSRACHCFKIRDEFGMMNNLRLEAEIGNSFPLVLKKTCNHFLNLYLPRVLILSRICMSARYSLPARRQYLRYIFFCSKYRKIQIGFFHDFTN